MKKKEQFDLFVEISALLTGFSEPELWGTGMMETYHDWLTTHCDADDLKYFFDLVSGILKDHKGKPDQINDAIRSIIMPASTCNALAQKLITLWYMGIWGTTPATPDWSAGGWVFAANAAPISAESYIQGVVWNAGQTHPPGAKQPGFGSWGIPPVGALG